MTGRMGCLYGVSITITFRRHIMKTTQLLFGMLAAFALSMS